ncbi:MAG: hypothetical protein COB67_13960 [SAR324 cluster bacterium]|uniref:HD-GYP domain-containing protein n=1 Tax=SAR324 cluster bacterium TaxID=2024889 RepID=A0A2A4SJT7_9DELT|nr:MAG: hypothetical protein COB67_13960 [SAR324 cluster bacterium]
MLGIELITQLTEYWPMISLLYCYFAREVVKPSIYINSLFVGLIINQLSTGNMITSVVPFIVPVFVQLFSRTSMAYSNRHKEMMLNLPMEREDPVLIMDQSGDVLLAGKQTEKNFSQYGISNLYDYIGTHNVKQIVKKANSGENESSIEVYSKISCKWYDVKFKLVPSQKEKKIILIWMIDITQQKELRSHFAAISQFNHSFLKNLNRYVKSNDLFYELAELILKVGYQGVFITKADKQGNLIGKVTKRQEEVLEHSKEIVISKDSSAPVLHSRQQEMVVSGEISDFSSRQEFETEFPFDERVKEFLGFPINNFVNYHETDFSIIAFNQGKELSEDDSLFIGTLVNNTRAIVRLLNLAIANEEQFLQKVMGLCSAAEYSDEITGKHILRVNAYSKVIAQKMGCSGSFIEAISQVAALHDIGKVAIPELIKLPKKYTPEEREMMQMHTVFGAQIIKTMMNYSSREEPKLKMAYNIALHHHQTWMGNGYPNIKGNGTPISPVSKHIKDYRELSPLKGEEIPIEALITGLADCYDALRSKRQYKPEFSHEKTYKILAFDDRLGISGAERFSPQVWQVFEEFQTEFAHIFESMQD